MLMQNKDVTNAGDGGKGGVATTLGAPRRIRWRNFRRRRFKSMNRLLAEHAEKYARWQRMCDRRTRITGVVDMRYLSMELWEMGLASIAVGDNREGFLWWGGLHPWTRLTFLLWHREDRRAQRTAKSKGKHRWIGGPLRNLST